MLVGVNAQLYESIGRILLGDNAGGGAVMLSPIGFQRAGVWNLRTVRLSPDLTERNSCVSRGVCVCVSLRETGSCFDYVFFVTAFTNRQYGNREKNN